MPEAISNTSPMLYLHRIGVIEWLSELFGAVWIPPAVVEELAEGRERGYDVPELGDYPWLEVVNPRLVPSEWLTLDLGKGELATMALALENRERVVPLDDALARRIAGAAKLEVWGTLRVMLEAKSQGLAGSIEPFLDRLEAAGMWISADVRHRVLVLAREGKR
jgi:predicted nucleic acid-binding protein